MKKNKIAILIILILAIISVIYIVSKDSKDTLNDINRTFAIRDTSSIVKIFIADMNNNKVLLKKNENNTWFVNDKYAVKQDMIKVLLETFYKIRASEPASISSRNTIMKVLATQGKKVEVYVNSYRINLFDKIKLFPYEKKEKVFYVGEATQDQLGTMMLIEGSEDPMITYIPSFRGFLSTRFDQFENNWRDNSIFRIKYNELKSVDINYNMNPENSFKIEKNNMKDFTLYNTNKNVVITDIDTMSAIEYFSQFKILSYERVLDKSEQYKVDSLKKCTPYANIQVKNNFNVLWNLTIFRIKLPENSFDYEGKLVEFHPDKLYCIINNNDELVTIQHFVLDNILKDITYFYKDKSLTLKNKNNFLNL